MTADTPDVAKLAAKMRARAAAATPYRWRIGMTASDGSVAVTVSMPFRSSAITCLVCAIDHREADRVHVPELPSAETDAEHIVASQPANVLALFDAFDARGRKIDQANARADKAERLIVEKDAEIARLKGELETIQEKQDDAFDAWMQELNEQVIQGEYGYEEGEFTAYPDEWKPLYEAGLSPTDAFARALKAFGFQRSVRDAEVRATAAETARDAALDRVRTLCELDPADLAVINRLDALGSTPLSLLSGDISHSDIAAVQRTVVAIARALADAKEAR